MTPGTPFQQNSCRGSLPNQLYHNTSESISLLTPIGAFGDHAGSRSGAESEGTGQQNCVFSSTVTPGTSSFQQRSSRQSLPNQMYYNTSESPSLPAPRGAFGDHAGARIGAESRETRLQYCYIVSYIRDTYTHTHHTMWDRDGGQNWNP